MHIHLIVAAAAILMTSANTWADTSPLAPAKAGMLACSTPNRELKTCSSMGRFEWAADGIVTEFVEVLASANPVIIAKIKSQSWATEDGFCFRMQESDVQSFEFFTKNGPLPELDAKIFRNYYVGLLKDFLNKEACDHYSKDGDFYVATITVDGARWRDYSEQFIWVAPGDGYTVAP